MFDLLMDEGEWLGSCGQNEEGKYEGYLYKYGGFSTNFKEFNHEFFFYIGDYGINHREINRENIGDELYIEMLERVKNLCR